MLTREEDIDVHALRRQGMSISAIARHLGRDRKTIRAYLNGDRAAGVRKPAEDDPFAPFVVQSAQDDPFAVLDGGADYRRERKAL